MFFQVQAFGKVDRNPELVVTKDGAQVTEFSLAVTTIRCVEEITVSLSCYAWGDQAEAITQSVSKGAMLIVQGDFTPHHYTSEDGNQEVSLEVNVEKFSFVDGSKPPLHKPYNTLKEPE